MVMKRALNPQDMERVNMLSDFLLGTRLKLNILTVIPAFLQKHKARAASAAVCLFSLLLASCATNGPLVHPREDDQFLTAAVVQFEIGAEFAADEQSFRSSVTEIVEEVMLTDYPDLIVFPEYTNVFLAVIPFYPLIDEAETVLEGFEEIREENPQITAISDIFILEDDAVRSLMDRVWGGLADKYDVTIVAGSYFAAEPALSSPPGEGKHGREALLKNRAVVYGPSGKAVYTQDKVFLTEFERDVVGMSGGTVNEAGSFFVEGEEVVLTLCRDTFFEVWEDQHDGAFLWFDLKANGTDFDREEEERFATALPERLASADVSYGATACLTGSFLDLFWEGESSVITRIGEGRVDTVAVSSTVDHEDVLVYSFPLAEAISSGEDAPSGNRK